MMPLKICSLDCIYCECGATTELTTKRQEYIPIDDIIIELDDFLANNPSPNYVTFGGSGEPTLNSELGKIIRHLKDRFPSQKLALLTNSTLLNDRQLRNDILPCDLILPSLDAATDEIFYKINKPETSINCAEIIDGLKSLSAEYKGEIWLEVFIAPGINDTNEEIALFKNVITEINPTRVQLNSLDRPGTISNLTAAPHVTLTDIARKLAPLPVEIVY
jgi:wyosine [tRNA(Phe)-imidazoG37] synthetase (radical SAM superfamily)